MPEWYRGEGVDVTPSADGQHDHDLTDGVYYTNQVKVAETYAAERSPAVQNRRVYKVQIDTASLRVLDLTNNAEWKKFMSTKLSSGMTPDEQLRLQAASKVYQGYFKTFLVLNKIKLDDFDVVIGTEYRLGGNQLCVLNKGGTTSPLAIRLRSSLVPLGTAAVPARPSGTLQFGGKIGKGMKIAGQAIAPALLQAAIVALIDLILGPIRNKMRREFLEDDFKRAGPDIVRDIKRHKSDALSLLADGKRAYAAIRISILTQDFNDAFNPMISGSIPPKLTYKGATITDKFSPDLVPDGGDRDVLPELVMEENFYIIYEEVTFSPEEVELYRNYVQERTWYEDQIGSVESREDRQRLTDDFNKLVVRFNSAMDE